MRSIIRYKSIFFLFLAVLVFSCEKKPDDNYIDTDATKLILNLDGIVSPEFEEVEINSAQDDKRTLASIKDFHIESALEIFKSSKQEISKSSFRSDVTIPGEYPPASTRTPIDNGVKYRVIVIDTETEKVIFNQIFTVGNKSNAVVIGRPSPSIVSRQYRVIAYSYNTTSEDDLTASWNNNLVIDLPNDKEFLYFNRKYTIFFQDDGIVTNTNLTFIQQTSKFGVVLDPRSTNGKVKAVAGNVGRISAGVFVPKVIVGTGTINLKNTEIIATGTKELDVPISYTGNADTLGVYAYSVQQKIDNFAVRLSQLSVDVPKSNANFGETTMITKSVIADAEKVISFAGFTNMEKGIQVNARIYLFNGFEVNETGSQNYTLWSYGNLYYDASAADNRFKYKIRNYAFEGKDSQGHSYLYTDYWRPSNDLYLVPNPTTAQLSNNDFKGDPCGQVYPKGAWHTPTMAEAELLLQSNHAKSGISHVYNHNNYGTARFVEYVNQKSSPLRFYGHGYYNLHYAIAPHLVAAFMLSSFTSGATIYTKDPRALVYTISEDINESIEVDDGQDDPIGPVLKKKYNGANTDAITNYDDDIATPRFNIRCVRSVKK